MQRSIWVKGGAASGVKDSVRLPIRLASKFAESLRDLLCLLDTHAAVWHMAELDGLIPDASIRAEVEEARNLAVLDRHRMFEEGS